MSVALKRAEAAVELRRWDEALEHATRAVAEEPEDLDAHGLLAQALVAKGRHQEAVRAAETGLALDPESDWMCRLRSLALCRAGRHAEALAAADEAVRLAPNLAVAHSTRGAALEALKRKEEAVAAYGRAIELDPNNAPHHRVLGDALLDLKEWTRAEKHYLTSLALDPRDPVTLNNYGVTLERQGREEEARLAFKAAVLADPTQATAKKNVQSNVDRHLGTAAKGTAIGAMGLLALMRVSVAGERVLRSDSDVLLAVAGLALVVAVIVFVVGTRNGRIRRRAAYERLDPEVKRIYERVEADHRVGRL
jgi:tetratricopeptide (TPR) repeat protein